VLLTTEGKCSLTVSNKDGSLQDCQKTKKDCGAAGLLECPEELMLAALGAQHEHSTVNHPSEKNVIKSQWGTLVPTKIGD